MNDMEVYQELMLSQAHLNKVMTEFESRRIKEIQKRHQKEADEKN